MSSAYDARELEGESDGRGRTGPRGTTNPSSVTRLGGIFGMFTGIFHN